MYMIRPRPVRSHQHSQLVQTEHFFQNGSLHGRYDDADDNDDSNDDDDDDDDDDDAPAYMDVGHFRWFWPWGVRRSSTFDTMPAGNQRLPVAALLPTSSVADQASCLLFRLLPPELRRKIWTLVLQTQCSARWAYSRRSPAWRPDRTGALFIDAALLRTCRAVYLETWDLPMRLTQAVLADGTPQDKPGEWAGVVLSAGVLVPHAWQVLLLRRAEMTMQHFRLEAGFVELWMAALGKLKAAAATCVANLVEEERKKKKRGVREDVLRVLLEQQGLEEIVVRMNRMDWWTWTSVPPAPWPEGLPGECVADIREAGRRREKEKRRRRRRRKLEEEREMERERWMRKEEEEDGEMRTDEESMEEDVDSDDGGNVEDGVSVTSYNEVEEEPSSLDDVNADDEQGGYFSDHTASDASSTVYIFDAATLPESLCLVPFKTESWDAAVLAPHHLRVTLMLETFGPKSLQLDAALDEVKTWRLPMPAAAADNGGGKVLAWDGRPVVEYHWLRDMSDEVDDAPFLKMAELKDTAEGVVVKMMTLAPRSV